LLNRGYLHHHKYAWIYIYIYIYIYENTKLYLVITEVIFMFISSDTKYPYCELPEMPELHNGVWSQLTCWEKIKLQTIIVIPFIQFGYMNQKYMINIQPLICTFIEWCVASDMPLSGGPPPHTHKHKYRTWTVLHHRSSKVRFVFKQSSVHPPGFSSTGKFYHYL
jgi:hypothetical protein